MNGYDAFEPIEGKWNPLRLIYLPIGIYFPFLSTFSSSFQNGLGVKKAEKELAGPWDSPTLGGDGPGKWEGKGRTARTSGRGHNPGGGVRGVLGAGSYTGGRAKGASHGAGSQGVPAGRSCTPDFRRALRGRGQEGGCVGGAAGQKGVTSRAVQWEGPQVLSGKDAGLTRKGGISRALGGRGFMWWGRGLITGGRGLGCARAGRARRGTGAQWP